MTAPETEFVALAEAYQQAFLDYGLTKALVTDKPQYIQSDYYRPNEMAAFKQKAAVYDEIQALLIERKEAVEQASKALDKWIPPFVLDRLILRATILSASPGGFIALSKNKREYFLVRGASEQSCMHRINEYFSANSQ